eukprot:1164802_1
MDTDFITVSAFSATIFDAMAAYISDVLCYVPLELTTQQPTVLPTFSPTDPNLTPPRESCSTFTTQDACVDSQGACGWTNSICHCKSSTELDILFAIDASGSVGEDNWKVQRDFIKKLVVHDINIDVSKIGFAIFSTKVNFSRSIQSWQTSASVGESCPTSLCPISGVNISAYNQYLPLIQDRDIRTIIVAIGPGVNTLYLDCLTQMDTDFITV